jgi:hypothetical protein
MGTALCASMPTKSRLLEALPGAGIVAFSGYVALARNSRVRRPRISDFPTVLQPFFIETAKGVGCKRQRFSLLCQSLWSYEVVRPARQISDTDVPDDSPAVNVTWDFFVLRFNARKME